jgi:hypothetical protein
MFKLHLNRWLDNQPEIGSLSIGGRWDMKLGCEPLIVGVG